MRKVLFAAILVIALTLVLTSAIYKSYEAAYAGDVLPTSTLDLGPTPTIAETTPPPETTPTSTPVPTNDPYPAPKDSTTWIELLFLPFINK